MENFDPSPLPIDPSILVCGIVPESCFVFKSALCPLKLTFKLAEESKIENPRI